MEWLLLDQDLVIVNSYEYDLYFELMKIFLGDLAFTRTTEWKSFGSSRILYQSWSYCWYVCSRFRTTRSTGLHRNHLGLFSNDCLVDYLFGKWKRFFLTFYSNWYWHSWTCVDWSTKYQRFDCIAVKNIHTISIQEFGHWKSIISMIIISSSLSLIKLGIHSSLFFFFMIFSLDYSIYKMMKSKKLNYLRLIINIKLYFVPMWYLINIYK